MSTNRLIATKLAEIKSDKPQHHFYYTPSIVRAPNGALLLSFDVGGEVSDMHGFLPSTNTRKQFVCKIYRSLDSGSTWNSLATLPMTHARLLRRGAEVYVIGHQGRVCISKSLDNGQTWSDIFILSNDSGWHGSACNVWENERRLYLCLERRSKQDIAGWNVAGLAPHIFSAPLDADLLTKESWERSYSFAFQEVFDQYSENLFGLPFYGASKSFPSHVFHRDYEVTCAPMGWLEGNVVQFDDPRHLWHDPRGRTLYIFLRLSTGGTGYAAILKVVENNQNKLYSEIIRSPAGQRMLFLPFPGGHNKFFITLDRRSGLFWMASTQAMDSMRTVDARPDGLFGLPNNERNRLVLYFSTNCVDWCFAGVIAVSSSQLHSNNYPAFILDGDDIILASRSGDDDAKDCQYNNTISVYRICNFRSLVY